MYNIKKVCIKCGWTRAYDSNRDNFGFGKYVYCPICGEMLDDKKHSPDI